MAETRTSIKFVRDFPIKPIETFNLLLTAIDTSELNDSTLFNDVQSVFHKDISVEKQQVCKKSTLNNVTAWHSLDNPNVCCRSCYKN